MNVLDVDWGFGCAVKAVVCFRAAVHAIAAIDSVIKALAGCARAPGCIVTNGKGTRCVRAAPFSESIGSCIRDKQFANPAGNACLAILTGLVKGSTIAIKKVKCPCRASGINPFIAGRRANINYVTGIKRKPYHPVFYAPIIALPHTCPA